MIILGKRQEGTIMDALSSSCAPIPCFGDATVFSLPCLSLFSRGAPTLGAWQTGKSAGPAVKEEMRGGGRRKESNTLAKYGKQTEIAHGNIHVHIMARMLELDVQMQDRIRYA